MRIPTQSDVFLLPHVEGHIVYAPLAGRIVLVNTTCVEQLREYVRTGDQRAVSPDIQSRLGGLAWLSAPPPQPQLPHDRLFHPTGVTLFLTNRCNLRCTYCYASAGEFGTQEMSSDLYTSAIDLVMRNAQRGGVPVEVGFHGGGEPTMAWSVLTGAVEYAREAAGRTNKQIAFGLSTNGCMPREHAEFVAEVFPVVTLSLDGPADIHDAQRPTAAGGRSFDRIMAFVETLRLRGRPPNIRCTVTSENVDCLPELVDFFRDHTGTNSLHFEPAFLSGRCEQTPGDVPEAKRFSGAFIGAMDRAAKRGISVRFSAARLGVPNASFCGCAQDAFTVTPDGFVTACFEVCRKDDPLAKTFHFGRYDAGSRVFRIDASRLSLLRAMTVQNKPLCQRCFAKWNCAGDCPIRTKDTYLNHASESPRCRMIQEITHAMITRALKSPPAQRSIGPFHASARGGNDATSRSFSANTPMNNSAQDSKGDDMR